MKNILLLILAFALSPSIFAKEVPLEVFAKHPKYRDMKVSPTGEYIAFTFENPDENQVNLAVMERESMKVLSSFEFGEDRHIVSFAWLNDERIGMDVEKRIGWLDGVYPDPQWAAANADGSNKRILWDFQRAGMVKISSLKDEPEFVLLGKRHWADKGKLSLMKMNINTGKYSHIKGLPESARHTTPGIVGVGVNLNEELAFAIEFDRGDDEVSDEDDAAYVHYKKPGGKWKRLGLPSKRVRPNVTVLGTSKSNDKFYILSNHDQVESDSLGLFEFDANTNKIKLLFRHDDVDIAGGVYAPDGYLVGVRYNAGYPEYFYIENEDNSAEIQYRKAFAGAFKGQLASIRSRTKDENLAMVRVTSDRNPGEFYFFDRTKRKLSYFASSKSEVRNKQMARVEPFTMKARDGLKMYGFLTIPNNVEEKNLPLVLYPHGGPYGVADTWRWDRRAQMLASRGYLVLQLNFRGSGGYGEDFEDEGYPEWGLKMQDDLTDATKWAIETGLADPERICIHGVSYGGYASMNAVVKEPDLYKCSIPDAGVYDMELQWDEADSFKGANRKYKDFYITKWIGGEKNNRARSPAYQVDKLKAKLLIVHGGEDVRVPISNAYALEKELKKRNISYETLYKDEEGHGFTKVDNRVELYSRILEFLEKHIGPGAKPKKS